MSQEVGIYFSVGTLLALILAIASIVRRFTKVEARVDIHDERHEHMDAEIENIGQDVRRIEREDIMRSDQLRQQTGEVGAALRQRIHEVDIATRDRMDRLASDIRESIEKLGDRLEGKIDRAVGRKE